MTLSPTRLRILFATESDFALVLRSGPARHVAAIGWNRDRDTFKLGQWLKARINDYDLSPDGRHFLYCASKYDPKVGDRVDYTVMARPPYFTALHCWSPQHRYYGGAFLSNTRFWLLHWNQPDVLDLPDYTRVPDAPELKPKLAWSSMSKMAAHRCERDGWVLQPADYQRRKQWRKVLGDWTLSSSLFSFRNPQPDFYELLHGAERTVVVTGQWDWADLDVPRNRLCFAQGGELWSLELKPDANLVLLHDFSDMKFEERRAPY